MIFGPLRLAFKIFRLLVAAVVIYYAVTLVQVWLTSRRQDPHPAQAIVVMGASESQDLPTLNLAARLQEALALFRQGDAHLIALTGGVQPGATHSEAQAGQRYLESYGVPAADIVLAGGTSSWQELADLAPELRARGDANVLVVTDPFREDLSMATAADLGLHPSPTPSQTSPIKGWATFPYFLKEALGVSLGRVIGYQNLHFLG